MECPEKRQSGRNKVPPDYARVLKKCSAPFPRSGNFAIFEQGSGWRKKESTQRNASTREKFVDPTLVDTKAGKIIKLK